MKLTKPPKSCHQEQTDAAGDEFLLIRGTAWQANLPPPAASRHRSVWTLKIVVRSITSKILKSNTYRIFTFLLECHRVAVRGQQLLDIFLLDIFPQGAIVTPLTGSATSMPGYVCLRIYQCQTN